MSNDIAKVLSVGLALTAATLLAVASVLGEWREPARPGGTVVRRGESSLARRTQAEGPVRRRAAATPEAASFELRVVDRTFGLPLPFSVDDGGGSTRYFAASEPLRPLAGKRALRLAAEHHESATLDSGAPRAEGQIELAPATATRIELAPPSARPIAIAITADGSGRRLPVELDATGRASFALGRPARACVQWRGGESAHQIAPGDVLALAEPSFQHIELQDTEGTLVAGVELRALPWSPTGTSGSFVSDGIGRVTIPIDARARGSRSPTAPCASRGSSPSMAPCTWRSAGTS